MNIGSRLASFRKSQDLGQREFAERVGVSTSMIGNIESGARMPSRDLLAKLGSAFDLSADWLLNGTEPMLLTEGIVRGNANNLAFYRAMRGYTQSDLSARTDLSLYDIEAAEVGDPSVRMDVYEKCAQALDVTLAQIFDEPRRNVEKHLAKALGDVPLERLIEIARNVKSDLGSK